MEVIAYLGTMITSLFFSRGPNFCERRMSVMQLEKLYFLKVPVGIVIALHGLQVVNRDLDAHPRFW